MIGLSKPKAAFSRNGYKEKAFCFSPSLVLRASFPDASLGLRCTVSAILLNDWPRPPPLFLPNGRPALGFLAYLGGGGEVVDEAAGDDGNDGFFLPSMRSSSRERSGLLRAAREEGETHEPIAKKLPIRTFSGRKRSVKITFLECFYCLTRKKKA